MTDAEKELILNDELCKKHGKRILRNIKSLIITCECSEYYTTGKQECVIDNYFPCCEDCILEGIEELSSYLKKNYY